MDAVTVTIEQDTLTTAMARLGDAAEPILLDIAKDTADALKAGVQSRLRRQTAGTGRTANAIAIERVEGGFRVHSGDMGDRPDNLPIWLEFGTKHMTPKPAWEAERQLAAGPYLRRVENGLQQAIDGLGGA